MKQSGGGLVTAAVTVQHGRATGAAAPGTSEAAANTTGRSLLKGGAWTTFALALPQVFTLLLSVFAARALGPVDMGRQSYMAFVGVSVSLLCAFGLPTALQRFVARAAGQGEMGCVRGLAAWAERAGLTCAVIAIGATAAVGLSRYPDLHVAWILAGLVAGLTVMQSVCASVLWGLQEFRKASIIGLGLGAVSLVAAVIVLQLGYGITGMFATEASVVLVSYLGTRWVMMRAIRGRRKMPLDGLNRQVLRFALALGIDIVIDIVLTRRSEFIFLARYSTDSQIAFYSIAFALVTAAAFFPTALVQVSLPAVATLAGAQQHERIVSGYGRAARLLILATTSMAAVTVALGPVALRVVYGRDYTAAGTILVILAFVLLIGPLAGLASSALAGLGVVRLTIVCGLFGLIVNLALDLTLIPRWDAVGAAWANDGGMLAATIPLIYLTRRHIRTNWLRPILLWNLIVAVLTCTGAWGTVASIEPTLGAAPALLAGASTALILFFVLAVAVKLLDADDGAWLRLAAGTRWPALGRAVGLVSRKPT